MRGNGRNAAPAGPGQEIEVYDEGGELQEFQGQPTALEAVTRAEIDTQIATAKHFPRNITKFLQEAKTLVSLDPELAASCTYALPARRGSSQQITGPSVRLAEILAFAWQNLSVGSRIVDDDGKFITAQAVAFDAERNNRRIVEVKRGVTSRDGKRYGDDMVRVTGQAAMSIAKRNVTFEVIPRGFVQLVQDAAQQVARGDVKTLPARTSAAIGWFASVGVPAPSVFEALGISGPDDMTLDLLVTLQGYRTAIKEGHARPDDIFAPKVEAASIAVPGETQTEAVKRMLKPEPNPTPVKAEPVKRSEDDGK